MQKAKVLFEKGVVLMNEGDWPRASEALREALDQLNSKTLSDEARSLLSMVLRKKAHVDSRLSDLDLAHRELEQALSISKDLKDKRGMADAYRGLGYVHIILAEADEAMACYMRALGLAEGTEDQDLLGRIRLEIGNVHMYWYDYEKAKEQYGKALRILKTVGNRSELARVYNNLGEAHKGTGDIDESIEYHRRCMELAKEIGNITMTGFAALNAAECFVKKRDLRSAREYLEVAARQMNRSNDRIGLASTWRIYGMTYQADGMLDDAEKAFNKSIEIAKMAELPNLEAEAMIKLVEVLIKKKETAKARELAKKAVSIFKDSGRTQELVEAKKLLEELKE